MSGVTWTLQVPPTQKSRSKKRASLLLLVGRWVPLVIMLVGPWYPRLLSHVAHVSPCRSLVLPAAGRGIVEDEHDPVAASGARTVCAAEPAAGSPKRSASPLV